MLPTEDLFVYIYVLIDDLVTARIIAIPPRPGPAPGCSDAELLTIATTRHVLGRRSEAGFLAEVARDRAHLFPHVPHQSEANRRICWLRGASGQLRCHLARQVPEDDCQQIDTSALPVTHTSRVRGPDSWTGPDGLHARFGRDAAHAEWSYGLRLAIKTDLGTRIIRAWNIVPAAINERDAAGDLLETGPPPRDLLEVVRDSTALPSPPPRPAAAPPSSCRPPTETATACHPSCGRSSPNGATGSRQPSKRSPTRWNSPATVRTPSGACSPAPPRSSLPTPSSECA
jgi:hypothetical protein